MEYNKEEAIRAKAVAEKKMENKDFVGALKIAQKAQNMYPDLENISQLITVCEVHCSAEKRLFGNEKDWYGILKIDAKADDLLIKKQYRKLALLLHPDKNKFAGSTDAFKLIGEAQRTLLDREKRLLHDSKSRASGRPAASNPPPRQPNAGQSHWNRATFTSVKTGDSQFPGQRVQTGSQDARSTFWTICPFCHVRYQFYREVVNKLLFCQSCNRSFTGYEMSAQGGSVQNQQSQPTFTQQSQPTFTQQSQPTFTQQSQPTFPQKSQATFPQQSQVPFRGGPPPNISQNPKNGSDPKVGEASNVNLTSTKNGQFRGRKANGKLNGNRKHMVVESSESCDSESSTDSEVEIPEVSENLKDYGDRPRRSSRSKRNISYKENLSDDDDADTTPSKKAKGSKTSSKSSEEEVENPSPEDELGKMEEDEKDLKQEETDNAKCENEGNDEEVEDDDDEDELSNTENTSEEAEDEFDYPDPDFSDFDKYKTEDCFAEGQMWAAFDTLDAMPRFYALIREVLRSESRLKLQVTWLEADPDDEDEIKWAEADLPVSCGKFRTGKSEKTGNLTMFSHLANAEKGSQINTYKIYPRKGETWALFRNWEIMWYSSSASDGKRKFEYDFVEVLSDYDDKVGVSVTYLCKVKTLTSIFCCKTEGGTVLTVQIPPKEIFRFSHRVPSFQMTGEERHDVPKGSFELDPASLPLSIFLGPPLEEEGLKTENSAEAHTVEREVGENFKPAECCDDDSRNKGKVETNVELSPVKVHESSVEVDESSSKEAEPEVFECPDPDFSDFDKNRKVECFAAGQMWAVYDTADAMPRFYALIKKVFSPGFKLQITWLEPNPDDDDEIKWVDEDLPVSCGKFKTGNTEKAEDHPMFSHLVAWEKGSRRGTFKIYPRKGETWAVFKNWNMKWNCNPDENRHYEYEFVEVLTDFNVVGGVLISYLEKVKGFTCLFCRTKDSPVSIPSKEIFRFSHSIPSFRMTGNEREDVPEGSLELDPACLPTNI